LKQTPIENTAMAGGKNMTMQMCLAVVVVVLLAIAGSGGAEGRKLGKQSLGYYELRRGEFSMVLTNWGATILSVRLPTRTVIPPLLNFFFVWFKMLMVS